MIYKAGFDPGPLNSAISVFADGHIILEMKLAPVEDMNFTYFYRDLIWCFQAMDPPARMTIERFTSRGSASKIAEVTNIQIGMAICLCRQHGFDYRLVTASSWKRQVKPEYVKDVEPHLLDARSLALYG